MQDVHRREQHLNHALHLRENANTLVWAVALWSEDIDGACAQNANTTTTPSKTKKLTAPQYLCLGIGLRVMLHNLIQVVIGKIQNNEHRIQLKNKSARTRTALK